MRAAEQRAAEQEMALMYHHAAAERALQAQARARAEWAVAAERAETAHLATREAAERALAAKARAEADVMLAEVELKNQRDSIHRTLDEARLDSSRLARVREDAAQQEFEAARRAEAQREIDAAHASAKLEGLYEEAARSRHAEVQP